MNLIHFRVMLEVSMLLLRPLLLAPAGATTEPLPAGWGFCQCLYWTSLGITIVLAWFVDAVRDTAYQGGRTVTICNGARA